MRGGAQPEPEPTPVQADPGTPRPAPVGDATAPPPGVRIDIPVNISDRWWLWEQGDLAAATGPLFSNKEDVERDVNYGRPHRHGMICDRHTKSYPACREPCPVCLRANTWNSTETAREYGAKRWTNEQVNTIIYYHTHVGKIIDKKIDMTKSDAKAAVSAWLKRSTPDARPLGFQDIAREFRRSPVWIPDDYGSCMICGNDTGRSNQHHCRYCGWLICSTCFVTDPIMLDCWISSEGDHQRSCCNLLGETKRDYINRYNLNEPSRYITDWKWRKAKEGFSGRRSKTVCLMCHGPNRSQGPARTEVINRRNTYLTLKVNTSNVIPTKGWWAEIVERNAIDKVSREELGSIRGIVEEVSGIIQARQRELDAKLERDLREEQDRADDNIKKIASKASELFRMPARGGDEPEPEEQIDPKWRRMIDKLKEDPYVRVIQELDEIEDPDAVYLEILIQMYTITVLSILKGKGIDDPGSEEFLSGLRDILSKGTRPPAATDAATDAADPDAAKVMAIDVIQKLESVKEGIRASIAEEEGEITPDAAAEEKGPKDAPPLSEAEAAEAEAARAKEAERRRKAAEAAHAWISDQWAMEEEAKHLYASRADAGEAQGRAAEKNKQDELRRIEAIQTITSNVATEGKSWLQGMRLSLAREERVPFGVLGDPVYLSENDKEFATAFFSKYWQYVCTDLQQAPAAAQPVAEGIRPTSAQLSLQAIKALWGSPCNKLRLWTGCAKMTDGPDYKNYYILEDIIHRLISPDGVWMKHEGEYGNPDVDCKELLCHLTEMLRAHVKAATIIDGVSITRSVHTKQKHGAESHSAITGISVIMRRVQGIINRRARSGHISHNTLLYGHPEESEDGRDTSLLVLIKPAAEAAEAAGADLDGLSSSELMERAKEAGMDEADLAVENISDWVYLMENYETQTPLGSDDPFKLYGDDRENKDDFISQIKALNALEELAKGLKNLTIEALKKGLIDLGINELVIEDINASCDPRTEAIDLILYIASDGNSAMKQLPGNSPILEGWYKNVHDTGGFRGKNIALRYLEDAFTGDDNDTDNKAKLAQLPGPETVPLYEKKIDMCEYNMFRVLSTPFIKSGENHRTLLLRSVSVSEVYWGRDRKLFDTVMTAIEEVGGRSRAGERQKEIATEIAEVINFTDCNGYTSHRYIELVLKTIPKLEEEVAERLSELIATYNTMKVRMDGLKMRLELAEDQGEEAPASGDELKCIEGITSDIDMIRPNLFSSSSGEED
jgi:hypothetical protein